VSPGPQPPYVLVSGDFVKVGGMDRANHALAAYLLAQGREVHLVAHRVADDLLAAPGAVFHRVRKPLNSYLLGHPVLSHHGRRRAARVAAKGGRVVVNGGNCRWGDVNWLHHINVLDPPRTDGGLLRQVHRRLAYHRYVREDRAALRMARLVVTGCEQTRTALIDWLGTDPARVHTVYYGTDPTLFHPVGPQARSELRARLGWPDDRPVVAFVGALGDLRKGFDTLFDAWGRLCRDPGWDAHLVVVGTGPALPGWKARAEEKGLARRIDFLGFYPDLPGLMRAADAHVLPSRYEGYSLVTQEALCCGIPAFITRTAGIAERYPEPLRGLLIPDPEDAADLAARLRHWRERLGAYAAEVALFSDALRAYTWADMAARFVAIVEESR
jgi:glycosyltransferase involved in cell wall biosynthesis